MEKSLRKEVGKDQGKRSFKKAKEKEEVMQALCRSQGGSSVNKTEIPSAKKMTSQIYIPTRKGVKMTATGSQPRAPVRDTAMGRGPGI
jgi:hypothetical protein